MSLLPHLSFQFLTFLPEICRTNEKFLVKMKNRLPAILRDEKDEAGKLRAGAAAAAQGAKSDVTEVTDDEEDDSDEFEDY